jgi:anthranilate synthase component II
MQVLMIDNYDSFTFNIVQYFGELGAQVSVVRNDDTTVAALSQAHAKGEFTHLCVSPGPCSPAEAGISIEAITHFAGKLPILGVCLGHQSLGAAFGGEVVRAQTLMHGKVSEITTTQQGVFRNLPERFTVNRYHSLAVSRANLPACLQVTAQTADGEIMGLRHAGMPAHAPLEGVQFHPESILSEHGHALLKNFLDYKSDSKEVNRSADR